MVKLRAEWSPWISEFGLGTTIGLFANRVSCVEPSHHLPDFFEPNGGVSNFQKSYQSHDSVLQFQSLPSALPYISHPYSILCINFQPPPNISIFFSSSMGCCHPMKLSQGVRKLLPQGSIPPCPLKVFMGIFLTEVFTGYIACTALIFLLLYYLLLFPPLPAPAGRAPLRTRRRIQSRRTSAAGRLSAPLRLDDWGGTQRGEVSTQEGTGKGGKRESRVN